ncbi:MAG TPA: hypothetical protein VFG50_07060 [Rhodothermales bacterium]|nr:hypothetical protein [Rhodothermales bacterium]
MFRFSMDKGVPLDTNQDQLVTAQITPDPDWADRLMNTGEYREDERYFRAENSSPDSVGEAVEFVQGIMFHAPRRVWMGDKEHDVTESIAAAVRKPTAPGETRGPRAE